MLKRFIIVTLSVVSLAFFALALQPATSVLASTPQDEVCKGVGAGTGAGCTSNISLTTIIRNVINIFSIIVGIVAVIMIMVAGFKFITAGGESSNIASARQTVLYAVIGLAVTALSQSIVWFVLNNVD